MSLEGFQILEKEPIDISIKIGEYLKLYYQHRSTINSKGPKH